MYNKYLADDYPFATADFNVPLMSFAPFCGITSRVANAFEPQLRKAAEIERYRIGTIEKSPMKGLINYYFK